MILAAINNFNTSDDADVGMPFKRSGGYGGPRGFFRGGRRGGFSNGDGGEGDHPRRPLDRRSGTGYRYESTREGVDHGNWETQTDELVIVVGGISCSFSTVLMHPINMVKRKVNASFVLYFIEIMSKLPHLGVRGLYMGSIPARVGQFLSHGLRTGICEVTKIALYVEHLHNTTWSGWNR